jgi:hypothetical protein
VKIDLSVVKTVVLTTSNITVFSPSIRRPTSVLCSNGRSHVNREGARSQLTSLGINPEFYYSTSTVGSKVKTAEKANQSYKHWHTDNILLGKSLLNRHPHDTAKSYIDILTKSFDGPVLIVDDRFRFLDRPNITTLNVPKDADAVVLDADYNVDQTVFTDEVQGRSLVPAGIVKQANAGFCRLIGCGHGLGAVLYLTNEIKIAAIAAYLKAMEPVVEDGLERFISPGTLLSKLVLPYFNVYTPTVPIGVTTPYGNTKGTEHAKKYSQIYWSQHINSRHPELADIALHRASLNKPVI